MDSAGLYQSKLTTPDQAVSSIASGSTLSIAMAMAAPPALLKALAERAAAGQVDGIKAYYFEANRIVADTILRYELMDRIHPHCMFLSGTERALIRRGEEDGGRKVVDYVPNNFHQATRILTEQVSVDTFVCTVSPMDQHGYFSFGTGNDYSTTVARAARRLIVEVNRHMPRVHGIAAALHVSEVDAIVENHVPLLELPVPPSAPEDEIIGRIIADLVPDGACLQMGVGALPNLVCAQLRDRKHLGIHTEALNSGLVDLVLCGAVDNSRKAVSVGKTVFTFAMGQKAMYDFLHDNAAVESGPVAWVNDPRTIALNDGAISINATIQIDLTGACNSEHMLGHQYSASGGQARFRARRLRLEGRQIDHRHALHRRQGQGLAHRAEAGRPGDDAAYRHALHHHGIRRGEPQRPLVERTRPSPDRPRPPSVPRRTGCSRQGAAPDLTGY